MQNFYSKILLIILLLSVQINLITLTRSISLQRALLFGIGLEQLAPAERHLLQNYEIIEENSFNQSLIKALVLEKAPSLVIVKQDSGVYAYSPGGQLLRPVSHNLNSLSAITHQEFNSPLRVNQDLISPNYTSAQSYPYPMPGGQIPNNLYPGDTSYQGFLPGEGFNLRNQGRVNYSGIRNSVKQLASLSQSVVYPFWFDTFLQANTQFGSPESTTVAGTPPQVFQAETTTNAAIVGGQLTSNALGIGSLLVDSYLDRRELQQYENWANSYSQGTAQYYQPQQSYNYYPPVPGEQQPYSLLRQTNNPQPIIY